MRALLAQLEKQNRQLEQKIADRKQAQTALQSLNETLETQVAERTAKLRALSARLAEVQENERQRLARELHDQVGQLLTGVGFNLGFVQSQLPEEEPLAAIIQPRLAASISLVEQMVDHIRVVIADLRPPLLDEYGLGDALVSYAASFADLTGLSVTVTTEPLSARPARAVENALFRIAQEALNNVVKHAQASQVTISLEADEQTVRLIIADDGIGFSADALPGRTKTGGWGLLTMSERAEMFDALYHIESQPDQGTRVIVEAPHAGRAKSSSFE
jgi:signal transduction histidine kinase